ncbi:DUF3325 domain-containing protein [Pantoea sp. 18069]|uniref:DUF3325 domain-containing protein n=1 Tax=Pantoea sp. 18069 TaxID=2681415 RepID=UPI00135C2BAB|nr:DUF3325 domain-containing protein [Pantoea sp. 18069]
MTAWTAWTAWALAFPAFAALSLAMERHQDQVFGRALASRPTWAWRLAGIALLVLSLVVCAASAWSWSVAISAWLGLLTLAALLTGLVLTYTPSKLLPLGCASMGVGVLALVTVSVSRM